VKIVPNPEAGPERRKELQTRYYGSFRCLADACPDTCCEGWRVALDKKTYSKYQQCSDPVLQPAFQQLITINPASTSDDTYATFTTSNARCTFLSEGLCSIQSRLGEQYLGAACAAFPRVTNLANGVVERSLDLSCPEAARLALLNPTPLEFCLVDTDVADIQKDVAQTSYGRLLESAFSSASGLEHSRGAHERIAEVRQFVLSLLQNRKYPLSKRLILLGHFCDKLREIITEGNYQAVPELLQGFAFAIEAGLFNDYLSRCTASPAAQLGIVLELIAERVKSDFTHRRFLQFYQEFINGIRWKPDATHEEMAGHYADAYRRQYAPFMSQHEYMLENYLVNNAFRTLFPFGSQSMTRALNMDALRAVAAHYMLLTSYFSILKAMLIGLAGNRGAAFGTEDVIRGVQLCSKTFEHSVTYPKRILEILAMHGIETPAGMRVLTQN